MVTNLRLIGFRLDNQRFAIPFQFIESIVHVVEINQLPQMPDFIKGIINFHGIIIPVLSPRILFRMEEKEIELSDQLMIVNTSSRKLALLVDSSQEVFEIKESDMVKSDKILSGIKYLKGVIRLEDEMILINDIDEFLSDEELARIEVALDQIKEID